VKFFIKYYLLFILIIPYGIIKVSSLYNIKTPFSLVNYDYLDYHMSLFLLPFALIIFPKSKEIFQIKKKKLMFYLFISLIFIRNIYLIYFDNLKYLFSLDLFLSLLFGVLIYKTFKHCYDLHSHEKFLNWIVLFHFIGILISIIFSLNKIDFRFNAQNLDVGSTGLIFGLIFLIKITYFKTDIYAVLSLIIVILCGSRFCLLLTIGLLLIHSLSNFKLSNLIVYLFLFSVIFYSLSGDLLERILSSFTEIQDVSSTDKTSVGGRLLSIITGIEVLLENFMNVSFSSVNLVFLMNKYGYPTYPHSYFLISLIYFPILSLFIFIKLIKRLYKFKNIVNLYIVFAFVFYGGITFNYKVYALILILLYITYQLEKPKKNEVLSS
jgi:hypothetical protein